MLEDIKEKTGFFDERFFFLVEDVDLSWRAQKIGWKAKFIPEMVCYHAGNSSGYDKSFRQYLCFRNRRYMVAKNENIFGKIKLIPIFFVYDFPRSLYISLNRKIKKEVTG
jgi:GT2 family glycosyltransferase